MKLTTTFLAITTVLSKHPIGPVQMPVLGFVLDQSANSRECYSDDIRSHFQMQKGPVNQSLHQLRKNGYVTTAVRRRQGKLCLLITPTAAAVKMMKDIQKLRAAYAPHQPRAEET